MRRIRQLLSATVFLLLIGLIIGAQVLAGDDYQTKELLMTALLAPTQYSYQGTIVSVVWSGQHSCSSVIQNYHQAPSYNRWEFVDTCGEPQSIIIDNAQERWEISPTESKVRVAPSIERCDLAEAHAELIRLYQNYTVSQVGTGQIVGRQTKVLDLSPKFQGNPRQVLWIDTSTGLVLRWEKYKPDGNLSQLGYFSSFELVDKLEPTLFQYTPKYGEVVERRDGSSLPQEVVDLQKQLGEVIRYPGTLPPGYQFSRARVLSRYQPNDTVHLQFTDGLNSISVFETFRPFSGVIQWETLLDRAARMTMEDTQVFLVATPEGYVLSWNKGYVAYSVVGDVPIQELKILVHSLRE